MANYEERENSQTQPGPAPVGTSTKADRKTAANDADRARAHDIGVHAVERALAEAA